ncbi:MAG TPA: MG2 domain-containing protein [Fimbriimonadales bacterium]|nr:MG2 domain-containing protein [Fimbriimonadales bacterium]
MKSVQPFENWLASRQAAIIIVSIISAVLFGMGIRDDTPLSTVHGIVTLPNGTPMPKARVVLSPDFDIEGRIPPTKTIRTDSEGKFVLTRIPSGSYHIEVVTKAHSLDIPFKNIEEGENELNLILEPSDPFLEVNLTQHVFLPGEEPKIFFEGFDPTNELRLKIYEIRFDKIVEAGGLESVLWPVGRWGKTIPDKDPSFEKLREIKQPLTTRDIEGVFQEEFRLPPLSHGFYWIEADTGLIRNGTYILVSEIALVTKNIRGSLLAYASHLKTGEPIEGANIYIKNGKSLHLLGKTNANGILETNYRTNDENLTFTAQYGNSRALVTSYSYGKQDKYRAFLYTDRPIYRPGNTIHFKGILRRIEGSQLKIANNKTLEIEIRDPENYLLERYQVTTNEMGSFAGSFETNPEGLVGGYTLSCKFEGFEEAITIPVAAYRKPEFSVTVKPDKPYFVRGDKASFTVSAEYYFGGPVVGAQVSAYLYRDHYWGNIAESEEEAEYYLSYYGRGAGSQFIFLKGITDENGKATFSIETDDLPEKSSLDWIYTIDAVVEEQGGKSFSGTGSLLVSRGAFALYVEPTTYVCAPGESIELYVETTRLDNNKPVPNVPVQINYYYEDWTPKSKSTTTNIGTSETTTGENGTSELRITPPRSGSLRIEATAKDNRGNIIVHEVWIWVARENETLNYNYKDLEVTLDKPKYKTGENAKAVINTKHAGVHALVTLEGERVYRKEIVLLKGNTNVYEFPITQELLPNAYISVCYVKNKTFYESDDRLLSYDPKKTIRVEINSDKETYEPGEEATYTIRTLDENNQPVDADCSLAVVDESIFAILEDNRNIYDGFYPIRYNNVNTGYSFPQIYFGDEDKGDIVTEIRRRFLDTAAWIPFIRTGPRGIATVKINLPHNITSWRATVKAATADTAVGSAKQLVTVRKPLMVRLQAPRFFTQGDRTEIRVVVHNATGSDTNVRVRLDATNARIEESKEKIINVSTKTPETVSWYLNTNSPGNIKLTTTAISDNGKSDGMELTLPVLPFGEQLIQFESDAVTTEKTLTFRVNPNAYKASGGLEVTLSPTLASVALETLPYLIYYPYGCIEQTLNSFLPAVIFSAHLPTFSKLDPETFAKVPDIVEKGFTRIRVLQNEDGGWGWADNDSSSPEMTALVLEGFARARSVGYEPPEDSLKRGILFAKSWIENKNTPITKYFTSHIQLLNALARNGERDFVIKKLNTIPWNEPRSVHDDILLLRMFIALGENYKRQQNQFLEAILKKASRSPDSVHWDTETPFYWGAELTAMAAEAITDINPNHPVLPKILRWLMLKRRFGYWWSTKDTASTLFAIVNYLDKTKELEPDYTLDIEINGKIYRSLRINRLNIGMRDLRFLIPISNLKDGENTLHFRLKGKGKAYYSAKLEQLLPRESLPPIEGNNGLKIQRAFYELEPRRTEEGTLRLLPSKNPIESIEKGKLIRVVLRIDAPYGGEFALIECPIPAGCEIEEKEFWDEWHFWYSGIDILDDKIVYLARSLRYGREEIEFTLRAETIGKYRTLPASISNMYNPSIRATSSSTLFEIRP